MRIALAVTILASCLLSARGASASGPTCAERERSLGRQREIAAGADPLTRPLHEKALRELETRFKAAGCVERAEAERREREAAEKARETQCESLRKSRARATYHAALAGVPESGGMDGFDASGRIERKPDPRTAAAVASHRAEADARLADLKKLACRLESPAEEKARNCRFVESAYADEICRRQPLNRMASVFIRARASLACPGSMPACRSF